MLLVGCSTLPQPGPERALYNDLRAMVETKQRIDWIVDRAEIEDSASRIMASACQVPEPHRRALRAWLGGRIALEGGSAEAVWKAKDRDLRAAREILTLERVRGMLDYADQRTKECPFWLPRRPDFEGVQADAGRFVLMAESMGSLQVVLTRDTNLGGNGNGRLLPGYGVTDRLTIAGGMELGLASTFPQDDDGRRAVAAVVVGGVPVLARIADGTWRYDTEVAATFRAPEDSLDDPRYGLRISQAAGIAALRIAGAMPYVMAWAGYEWLPSAGGRDSFSVIRVGTRVGVNWDP